MTTSIKELLNNAQSIKNLNNKQEDLIKKLESDIKKILDLSSTPFIKIDTFDDSLTVTTNGTYPLLECELLRLKEFLGFETYTLNYSCSSIKITLYNMEEIETPEALNNVS